MIGTVLNDKYKIEKKIGEGGFGIVYRGFDTKLKRPVAIKILPPTSFKESFRKRFLRESEALAKLNHPNIVTVFDCGEHQGRPFLVMELVNGPSIEELVATTTLTLSQVCSFSLQICKAMSYAHDQGIIHRDLTLRNIMYDKAEGKDALIKILDFGLVKLLHSEMQTTATSIMGTPTYMPPEQILGRSTDTRADIFSFGVGLYRILNGHFPFEAEHPAALMYMIVNEANIDFVEDVPEELKNITLRCLEKDPKNRPHDFTEVAEEFKTLQQVYNIADVTVPTALQDLRPFAVRGRQRNPYLNRVMIKTPTDFFGRQREVRKIYSRLDAPHPQSISVVGDRRIGKSSLLNYIYNQKNRAKYMQNHEKAIFVYLDFQSDLDFDMPKFIDFIFSVFSYEIKEGQGYTDRAKNLEQLKEVVQELHEQGKRIIILMDEFEVITKNEKFEEDFFSFLRSLANSYRVAYITSSREELQLMCHHKDISDSPFFNIFSNLPLHPFNREEALELIIAPSSREGVPLEPYASQILELAGNFPFYLQIACSNVFEYLLDNPESEPDWMQISEMFKDEVFPHYSFLWERMEEQERENLYRIASGKPISKKYNYINENLLRRGYLQESNGELKVSSASFRDFVLAQMERHSGKKSRLSSFWGRMRGKAHWQHD